MRRWIGAAVAVLVMGAGIAPAHAADERPDDLAAYELHLDGQAERADRGAGGSPVARTTAESGLLAAAPVAATDFTPGNLISDAAFSDADPMSAAEIQAFLESKVACTSDTCLPRYRVDTRDVDWLYGVCDDYVGATAESAATIIFKVQQACGLNARVILVMLQKEQSLITDPAPTAWKLDRAMGYACPDTAACDPGYAGFFMQVAAASRQLTWYGNPAGSFTWIEVGERNAIDYHPDAARCGSSNVLIANAATAALYYYTPYQPNAAALANLYGTGDSCSAYGNRNFWRLHRDWFGDPRMAPAFDATRLQGPDRYATAVAISTSSHPVGGIPVAYVASGEVFADALSAAPAAARRGGPLLLVTPTSVPAATMAELKRLAPAQIVIAGSPGAVSASVESTLSTIAPVVRRGGSTRYETSRLLVEHAFASAPAAYLATGRNFPDGLSAGAAAGAADLPVLLVDGAATSADTATISALRRLGVSEVRIAGGTPAVSSGVQSSLVAAGFSVKRFAGPDRYATSVAINSAAFPTAPGAFLATGLDFPDALTGAAAAGAAGQPLYLAPGTCVPNTLRVASLGQGITGTTLLGSSAVLADAVGRLEPC